MIARIFAVLLLLNLLSINNAYAMSCLIDVGKQTVDDANYIIEGQFVDNADLGKLQFLIGQVHKGSFEKGQSITIHQSGNFYGDMYKIKTNKTYVLFPGYNKEKDQYYLRTGCAIFGFSMQDYYSNQQPTNYLPFEAYTYLNFLNLNTYDEKLEKINSLIEQHPEIYFFYMVKGNLLEIEGNFNKAQEAYKNSLKKLFLNYSPFTNHSEEIDRFLERYSALFDEPATLNVNDKGAGYYYTVKKLKEPLIEYGRTLYQMGDKDSAGNILKYFHPDFTIKQIEDYYNFSITEINNKW